MLNKIIDLLNIDSDIGNTLLLRLWSIGAGAVLVLIIPIFLSASEQGYYFTFSSLIGMQIFFELGFNFVVTQMISHEMANVEVKDNKLCGNEYSVKRIHSLISLLIKWYRIIAVLFFIVVFAAGYHFFYKSGALPVHSWLLSWFLIVLFSAVNIFISPFLAVLEGIGYVGRVARMRLYQSILGYLLLLVLFLFNLKLNAVPAISGIAAVFSVIYLFKKFSGVLFAQTKSGKKNTDIKISWRYEIFPFQWRIAISWISGYFIFQLFNPLIFAHQGAIEAGKLGLTLTIFSTILTLSMSWVNAKIPTMSQFISKGDGEHLNILFNKLFLRSLVFNIVLSVLAIIVVKLIIIHKFSLANRISDFNVIVVIAFVNIINHIIFCFASYMRAHKVEPLLFNSVITGGLVGGGAFFASKVSVMFTISSYMFILVVITLPWVYLLFRRFYVRNSRTKSNVTV